MSPRHRRESVPPWSGQWVADHLGVILESDHGALDVPLPALVGLALRRNPRRAHLLVSTVLAKHVPVDPRLAYAAGRLLGALVADALSQDGPDLDRRRTGRLLVEALDAPDPKAASAAAAALLDYLEDDGPAAVPDGERVEEAAGIAVLGYAETATALGHAVADALRAPYLHSTRRPIPGIAGLDGFEEEHSHAPGHLLLPERPDLFTRAPTLVLVDDEISTGRTVLNTIRALHQLHPRERYVLACLIDVRSADDRTLLADAVHALGAELDVVSLASGRIRLPDGLGERAAELLARTPAAPPATRVPAPVRQLRPGRWADTVRDGGRHGFTPADRRALLPELHELAARLTEGIAGDRVLVLGFEELMYAPQLLGIEMARRLGASAIVHSSTTTRSPVGVIDAAGYAIRSRLVFPAHDDPADGPGERYAYNVSPGPSTDAYTDIVVVVDEPAETPALAVPGGLLDALRGCCDRVQLAVIPSYRGARGEQEPTPVTHPRLPDPLHGPDFGSYRPDEVSWLLTDLSHLELEAPTAEREEAIQSGRAHYAESLPVEFQPDAEYQRLYHATLAESADRVAQAIGVVAEQVLARRGPDLALASLARAGTPVGILIRRWLAFAHGLNVPHYAVSIVRGRGIDAVALDWLAQHHDPARVAFVDGWTGKGAITRELSTAVAENPHGFSAELAVLADPGHCAAVYGTHADFLVPSACLNSTVSGLVSRTVLNRDYLAPGDFHGAKFYRHLADADVSADFLDVVSARFPAVADAVAQTWPAVAAARGTPSWSGWQAVERIRRAHGVDDPNLVKPGVGETTRVLLRRVPWKVLVSRDAGTELAHIRLLADQRAVPLEEIDDLPYSCVGLIRPSTRTTRTEPSAPAPEAAR